MNTQLLLALEVAIDKVLDANAERGLWEQYIYADMARDMAAAAALVFDASQRGQDHYESEQQE